MFPTKFANDAQYPITTHQSIHFLSAWPKKRVVDFVKKEGIAKFVTADVIPQPESYQPPVYHEGRIIGAPAIVSRSGCCSFTKDPKRWYFFPIHRNELSNVGIVEDDLIAWLKFLNDMRVGFKYLYFGRHESIPSTEKLWVLKQSTYANEIERITDNTFYWVAVSPTEGGHSLIPYLHWICLRYLINSYTSNNMINELKAGTRLAYYNIPRIAMFLHEHVGVPKLKAFLYAHVAHPFYCGYGLAFTDYMGQPSGYNIQDKNYYIQTYPAPCVNLTATEFRKIWAAGSANSSMNLMLTESNVSHLVNKNTGITALPGYNKPNEGYALFNAGKYKEYVKYVDDFYRQLKPKKDGQKKAAAVGTNS